MTTAGNAATQESAEDLSPLTIGVLALQGDYEAHARAFASAGASTVLVRKPEELKGIDGLVLPGGESTTMLKFLEKHGFFDTLGEFVSSTPCFATCAGCILVAREVLHPKQRSLGVLDATVERNAYGRQDRLHHFDAPHGVTGRPAGDGVHPRATHHAGGAPASKYSPNATASPPWCDRENCSRPPSIPR